MSSANAVPMASFAVYTRRSIASCVAFRLIRGFRGGISRPPWTKWGKSSGS
jgi:hypothetical protein